MRPLCRETHALMLQQAFCSRGMSSLLHKIQNVVYLLPTKTCRRAKQELIVNLGGDLNSIMGPLKTREEGERGMFVRGSERSWRHRLLFVCVLVPVCFSFSLMNKEGLYGVNGTLFLYNYSFPSLRQGDGAIVSQTYTHAHTHTQDQKM